MPSLAPPYVVPPTQDFDGNDGAWSSFKISLGTPGQDFRVLPATKSGETWAVVPDGCLPQDGTECPRQRGAERFQSAQSPGFLANESSTWNNIGQYTAGLEANLNYSTSAVYGYDSVSLGPAARADSLSLPHQLVGGIAALDYFLGYLPLAVQSSSFSSLAQPVDALLVQLWKQAKIPSLSFAYTAGAKYRLKSVFGSLIVGGYDSTRFAPSPVSFSFSNDASRLLTVAVQSIQATNTLQGTFSLAAAGHFSLVDSSVPHLWLPPATCDNFATAFGLTYDAATDLYLVNASVHDQLKARNPAVTLKLANSLSDPSANYTNIVLPYAAFDLQAAYPYYPSPTNYFPIRRAANNSQYTLGRTLLQEAYLIVDYQRQNFTVAQAAFPDPLPAADIVTIHAPSNRTARHAHGLGTAAVAGIAAGVVVLALLAAALAGFVLVRHRRRAARQRAFELANSQRYPPPQTSASQKGCADPQPTPASSALEIAGSPRHELASPLNEQRLGLGSPSPLSPRSNRFELDTPVATLGPAADAATDAATADRFEMEAQPLAELASDAPRPRE